MLTIPEVRHSWGDVYLLHVRPVVPTSTLAIARRQAGTGGRSAPGWLSRQLRHALHIRSGTARSIPSTTDEFRLPRPLRRLINLVKLGCSAASVAIWRWIRRMFQIRNSLRIVNLLGGKPPRPINLSQLCRRNLATARRLESWQKGVIRIRAGLQWTSRPHLIGTMALELGSARPSGFAGRDARPNASHTTKRELADRLSDDTCYGFSEDAQASLKFANPTARRNRGWALD